MANGKYLQKIEHLLEKSQEFKSLQEYLPTPVNIQNIIFLTNSGKIKKAYKEVNNLNLIYNLVKNGLDKNERAWFIDLLENLRHAIKATK